MPEHPTHPPTLGARYLSPQRCQFRVWAPKAQRVELHLLDDAPQNRPLAPLDDGYYGGEFADVAAGSRYYYLLDCERLRPDPASRWQPDGVHEASAVVDPAFPWTDQHWHGIPLAHYITYELHVGTFSNSGTFAGVIEHLDELRDLGITAVELMPVAQFPGQRNWGYDGVHPFAVQNSYGGPQGLKQLVDACHARHLAVVLDVVYNHLGPEGNYLGEFGYYFTDRYRTPWGEAVNFDGRHSDHVRRFFIENALYWIDEYHIDALRLDAVHTIFDSSAHPVLRELATAVRLEGERLNRRVYTIGESSANDPRLIQSAELGGHGLDAQWCNDLHHALRTTLHPAEGGYYADFHGFGDLVRAYQDGYVLTGQYSHYRGRAHGLPGSMLPPERLVVFAQNHDQVGNRRGGERLAQLVNFEAQKLSAALTLLSPYSPLLFMGEEFGATTPFHYFISHLDPQLIEAVRLGRRGEFSSFPSLGDFADPADPHTFASSRLDRSTRSPQQEALLSVYKTLIALRRTEAALLYADRQRLEVLVLNPGTTLAVRRWAAGHQCFVIFHCSKVATTVLVPLTSGCWMRVFDSADSCWLGEGSNVPLRIESAGQVSLSLAPFSAIVLKRAA